MAERKNFLDREKERQDGDSVLPYSIALIPGLTALEQDALVKDIAEGVVKKSVESRNANTYSEKSIDEINKYISDRKAADILEHAIQRMPEPLRDSWLMSYVDGLPPYFYDDAFKSERGIPDNATGYYAPDEYRVYISNKHFISDPRIAIHENVHKTNHDLNLSHPFYEGVEIENVPDRMVGIGLGKTLSGEFPKILKTPKGIMNRSEFIGEINKMVGNKDANKLARRFYENSLLNSGIYESAKQAYYPKNGSKTDIRDWNDFIWYNDKFIDDVFNLSPDYVDKNNENHLSENITGGHPNSYKEEKEKIADYQQYYLKNNGFAGRDFVEEGLPKYAAQSTESTAHLAELMSTRGGEETVKLLYPKTYNRMMNEYRNDPRRSWPKESLIPWQRYSHESNSNVYGQRGSEPEAFNPNNERHYVRVPDPYGGWHYGDDYTDVNLVAARRGKNYVEYRDLDGNWKRFYPNELKYVKEGKINRNKKWALELVKKLRNGVK
jgi:hypothetical protein